MALIDNLITDGWLKTQRIIEAFKKIKRVDFLPENIKNLAELNEALPIDFGQTISQPLVVAFMIEQLNPQPGEKILDIGSGSGWTTALLAYLVSQKRNQKSEILKPSLAKRGEAGDEAKPQRPSKQIQNSKAEPSGSEARRGSLNFVHLTPFASLGQMKVEPSATIKIQEGRVIAIEIIPELMQFGKQNVAKYNFVARGIVEFILADGSKGYQKEAPFDKILVSAEAKKLYPAWKEQLKIGGRIVTPIGSSIWLFIKKSEKDFEEIEYPGFAFVPLISEQ